jgi:hypothetical protein
MAAAFRDCGGEGGCRPGASCDGCEERERLYLDERTAKCDAIVAQWARGELSRIEAIDLMPDRSWGCEPPEQWAAVLADVHTGIDQVVPCQFGYPHFNLTRAAAFTCSCEGEIGTVLMVFDSDLFLSIAQDTVDGRGDACLLRFERKAIEAAVASCAGRPDQWFFHCNDNDGDYDDDFVERIAFPSSLVLPTAFEGIPSQKKRERSLGWHLVAYEELVVRPLVAAAAMEDCDYASGYVGPQHPTYGYDDATYGNEVSFNPSQKIDARGTTRSC